MKPSNRQELKEYCLRDLGHPVIEINVADEQLEDRIDEAINLFQTFHYDGLEKVYTSHLVTANNVTDKYIQMPDEVIGVTRIFPLTSTHVNSSGMSGFNMFDINYQIRLNELYDYTAGDYVYFVLANQHLRTLEMIFTGEIPIRYNRYKNILYVDAHWGTRIAAGNYIIIEVYKTLDDTTKFWGDHWLKAYTTALFKRQWGNNLKLFKGVKLPGGIELDGQGLYSEAVQEIERLQEQLRDEFEQPPEFLVG